MTCYIKDSDAILDYGFDWSNWLDVGETIVESTWTVSDGLTKISDTHTETVTKVWISGGTIGNDYTIVNHIITSNGKEDERSHIIRVRSR